MARATKKQALGRGLSALLKDPENDIRSASDKNAEKLVGHIVELDILDMVMPDMNGAMTFEYLKKLDPDVKVLLSSGYSLDEKAVDILNKGCNGFIQKPYDINQLAGKIHDILGNDDGQ